MGHLAPHYALRLDNKYPWCIVYLAFCTLAESSAANLGMSMNIQLVCVAVLAIVVSACGKSEKVPTKQDQLKEIADAVPVFLIAEYQPMIPPPAEPCGPYFATSHFGDGQRRLVAFADVNEEATVMIHLLPERVVVVKVTDYHQSPLVTMPSVGSAVFFVSPEDFDRSPCLSELATAEEKMT